MPILHTVPKTFISLKNINNFVWSKTITKRILAILLHLNAMRGGNMYLTIETIIAYKANVLEMAT